jgi:GT2 family glycosyltransferase
VTQAPPAASVVIPTHNRRELVLRAVAALLAGDPDLGLEVIVACDRCVDGTGDAVRRAFGSRVRVVNASREGQTGAYNEGIAAARGEILVFLDDDMEPRPGFVRAHVEEHLRDAGRPIAVIGNSEPVVPPRATALQRSIAAGLEALLRDVARAGHRSTPADLTGGNFSVRRDVITRVGGFDESFRFLCNDFELAARLLEAGTRFVFAPRARARALVLASAGTMLERATARATNELRLAKRYPWCRPHLPFYAPGSTRRWRRRILWTLGPFLAPVFARAAAVAPDRLRFLSLACAARYVTQARREIGTWRAYEALVGARPRSPGSDAPSEPMRQSAP